MASYRLWNVQNVYKFNQSSLCKFAALLRVYMSHAVGGAEPMTPFYQSTDRARARYSTYLVLVAVPRPLQSSIFFNARDKKQRWQLILLLPPTLLLLRAAADPVPEWSSTCPAKDSRRLMFSPSQIP